MSNSRNALSDSLKSWPINILPHHFVSRLTFRLTRIKSPLVTPVIRWFIKAFGVEMKDAVEQDVTRFQTFNAFFTRELKTDARPIANGLHVVTSPVDGTVSQAGNIKGNLLFQAKGHEFSLQALLGGSAEHAKLFSDGRFATIYLSPRDYHRIHMPTDAILKSQIHVPGRLFSVAPHTVNTVSGLFARNERVIALFDTSHGPLAMVLVGAINVAAIETVWSGLVTPPAGKRVSEIQYEAGQQQSFVKGQEMGRFNMGSTVILLFDKRISWNTNLTNGQSVKMGERIGSAGN